jgi:WD40 repeat protein
MRKLDGHRAKVRALAFSPDGRRLASIAGRETRVSLWDVARGARTLSPSPLTEGTPLAFDPDGTRVTIASGDFLMHWDLAADTFASKWFRTAHTVRQLAYSPDGSLLVAACYGGYSVHFAFRLECFRTAGPEKKTVLAGDDGMPCGLTFSADGRFLATVSRSTRVRVWRMDGKSKARSWLGPTGLCSVALSPDGGIAAVGANKGVTLYPATGRKPLGELKGHTGQVRALSFSPDGTLLSASADGTVRLWDLATQSEQKCFEWKIGPLSAATFSPDGTLAAAGGEDGLVVWDVG